MAVRLPCFGLQEGRLDRYKLRLARSKGVFWGGAEGGMQSITELEECERCKDLWLREVQEEFRKGNLSEDNHDFLHGRPTSVPGSWVGGQVACGNPACLKLVDSDQKRGRSDMKKHKKHILTKDCEECSTERASRALVALNSDDARLAQLSFTEATAVFANNDVK